MTTPPQSKSSWLIDTTPFFYGWVILFAGTVGGLMMAPSQTFTVGIFIDAYIVELGISRANISLLYGLATFAASMMLPITGRLVDRYGPSRMVLVVAFGLGVACMVLSLVQGAIMLFIGFLMARFMGFGSLQLVSHNVIAQWFIRRRGFVMGIAGLSLSLSLLIFPQLSEFLIAQFDWRGAWVVLGLLVWGVMLPLGWFLFKDTPEEYGLNPDGDPTLTPEEALLKPAEENWTLVEARETVAFWVFLAGLSMTTLVMAGVIFHQVSLFEVRDLSRETSIFAYNVMALFTVVGNLGVGRLLDKISPRWALAGILLCITGSLIFLQTMVNPMQAYLYSALLGLASGGVRVVDAVVWPNYFGRMHLGAIKGFTMIGVIGATSIGPYLLGFSYDYLLSYAPVLTGLVVLPVVIAVVALFVSRPQKKQGYVG